MLTQLAPFPSGWYAVGFSHELAPGALWSRTFCGDELVVCRPFMPIMITVGTSPKDWVPYREMHANYTGRIDYTIGLHPCYVDADWAEKLPLGLGHIGIAGAH